MRILKFVWNWFDDITGVSGWLIPLAKHPVPHARRSAWFYVLGSATLVVFVVQVVTGETRSHLIWSWLLSVLRHRERKRTTREFEGQAIRLSTEKPMPISIDGELLAQTPVTAKIARRAIRVAAPRPMPRAGS